MTEYSEFVLHCRAEATELCNCVYFVCHCTLAQYKHMLFVSI